MHIHRSLVLASLAVAVLGLIAVSIVFGGGAESASAQAYNAISDISAAPKPPATGSGFLGGSDSEWQIALFAMAGLLVAGVIALRFRRRLRS